MTLPSRSKSLQLVPQEGEDPEASFRALGKNFDLDPQVVQLLLKSHLKNFEEFRFFFSDEASVESFLAKIDLKDHQKVQVARLRRAWAALKAYYTQFEGDKSRVPESDLDTMLGESELRDAKTQFWVRYKLRFPPEVHPADSTLSRVSREMSKRMLCVFNVWKVKSLQFQLPPIVMRGLTWTSCSPSSWRMRWREFTRRSLRRRGLTQSGRPSLGRTPPSLPRSAWTS